MAYQRVFRSGGFYNLAQQTSKRGAICDNLDFIELNIKGSVANRL